MGEGVVTFICNTRINSGNIPISENDIIKPFLKVDSHDGALSVRSGHREEVTIRSGAKTDQELKVGTESDTSLF